MQGVGVSHPPHDRTGSTKTEQTPEELDLCDLHFQLLEKIGHFLDSQLSALSESSECCSDPDGFGLFDLQETICGMGFVALQTYITSVIGAFNIESDTAFRQGPCHGQSHLTIVSLVNHAANHWKHKDEWSMTRNDPRRDRILHALKEVVPSKSKDYPLCGMLSALSSPHRASFRVVLDKLKMWRMEI